MGALLGGAVAFELDLHENELVIVDVDDVVLDTGVTEIRLPGDELGFKDSVYGLKPQCPGAHRHDDIIILVPVPSRCVPGGEPPLGDTCALVVDLNRGLGCAPAGHDVDLQEQPLSLLISCDQVREQALRARSALPR
ncbi:uncharacterized protein METZ01_LOCUS478856, partial [marine metagenome]